MHEFRQPDVHEEDTGQREEGESEGDLAAATSTAGKGSGKKADSLQQLLQRMRRSKPALDVVKDGKKLSFHAQLLRRQEAVVVDPMVHVHSAQASDVQRIQHLAQHLHP